MGHSACLSACRCASERPKLRATRRYARRVLGPGTQNTILRTTKKRGRQPVAEARPPPTSAQALLGECRMPPAPREFSSEWCGIRRRATESGCWARRATVPRRSDACVTTVRPDVRSLCDRCILWTLPRVVALSSHLCQSLYRNFTAFRSQRAWSANVKTRTDF